MKKFPISASVLWYFKFPVGESISTTMDKTAAKVLIFHTIPIVKSIVFPCTVFVDIRSPSKHLKLSELVWHKVSPFYQSPLCNFKAIFFFHVLISKCSNQRGIFKRILFLPSNNSVFGNAITEHELFLWNTKYLDKVVLGVKYPSLRNSTHELKYTQVERSNIVWLLSVSINHKAALFSSGFTDTWLSVHLPNCEVCAYSSPASGH